MGVVLVTGGAGYIGSHAVKALIDAGSEVVVLDSLVAGHRGAIVGVPFVQADIADRNEVRKTIREYRVTAVVHFAAFLSVRESVSVPDLYYRNNVIKTLYLLDTLVEESIEHFVFSSSAAVYGNPNAVLIDENHRTAPVNAYGETKLAIERALLHYGTAYDLRSVSLRYFNAAGADASGTIGEDHNPEVHLIPKALAAVEGGTLEIFGGDYPTRDGTCERDYVHVSDLADAHVLALRRVADLQGGSTYNLGNGQGYSVKDVVASVERVTGKSVRQRMSARRRGDPPSLLAASEKARSELGWTPKFEELDTIVETAWKWHITHPNGYRSQE